MSQLSASKNHDPSETNVLLLQGGWNSESEVSIQSGEAIQEGLSALGYKFKVHDPKPNYQQLKSIINDQHYDIVFNGLHGKHFEDGQIQSFLDEIQTKYTHSNATASAIAMDKVATKNVLDKLDVPVPKWKQYKFEEIVSCHPFDRPYVIKPINEGSSVGVHIINTNDEPIGKRIENWPYGSVLVEKCIKGKELSVAIFRGEAMGVIELVPKENFYDFKMKYTDGMTRHIMPALIPQNIYNNAMRYAELAHQAIGCSTISRTDMRYDPESGELFLLEINTQPGFTKLSLLPEICKYRGVNFNDIIYQLIEDGLKRK